MNPWKDKKYLVLQALLLVSIIVFLWMTDIRGWDVIFLVPALLLSEMSGKRENFLRSAYSIASLTDVFDSELKDARNKIKRLNATLAQVEAEIQRLKQEKRGDEPRILQ